MPNDLANLEATRRAIDDVRLEKESVKRVVRILSYKDDLNVYEEECLNAWKNRLGRLQTIEDKLKERKKYFEES